MDLLIEKAIGRAMEHFLGMVTWNNLSRLRRVAIIELVQRYALQILPLGTGLSTNPNAAQLEIFAKVRLKEIERLEIISLITGNMREFPDINILDYQFNKQTFERLSNRMREITERLREMKFNSKFMEKRRSDILDALDRRTSILGDEYDYWVLGQIMPGVISDEDKKKIDEWLETLEDDKIEPTQTP